MRQTWSIQTIESEDEKLDSRYNRKENQKRSYELRVAIPGMSNEFNFATCKFNSAGYEFKSTKY